MSKKLLLLACIIYFVVIPMGNALKVSVAPSTLETYVNEPAKFVLTIKNDGKSTDGFVISVSGSHLEWMNLGSYYVKLNPGEERTVNIIFTPRNEGLYEYEIYVFSISKQEDVKELSVRMKVLPERIFRVEKFYVDKKGDKLEISVSLRFSRRGKIDAIFEVLDRDGRKIKYSKMSRELEGEKTLTETFDIGNLMADTYTAKVTVSNQKYSITKETEFVIPPVHNIVKVRKVVSNPLSDDIIITIRNSGNVVENYVLSEDIPPKEAVIFDNEPSSAVLEDNNVKYRWSIQGLAIGKEIVVKYSISRVPKIIGWTMVFLSVVGLLGLGVIKVRRPSIKKRYMRKRNEHLIVLEIKGSLTRELKNVFVKDRVSPLGKVIRQFEGPKPIIRESESGTELIWRIGNLKPKSEVILTYKVKPLIEAQLKMPRAYMIYKTDDKKVKVFSKQLILE
ncbi:MAG: hypothetical protein J7K72_00290 [Candidatus Aenigmarchaeota archaeon]|nr:hypothetical protein [Candidatus Aenigmarchaeota archaeon]